MRGMHFLGILLFTLEMHSAVSSSVEFSVYNEIEHKTCRNDDNAFKILKVPTIMMCGSICASDVDCKSFFYFPESLRCDGCKQTYSTEGQLQGAGEPTVYYSMAGHLTTTSTAITTTTTAEAMNMAYRSVGCYATPCFLGEGGCSYRRSGPIVGATIELCLQKCDGWLSNVRNVAIKDHKCYCDLAYETYSSGTCDIPCKGNAQQICGGETAVSVYEKGE